ncbi:hypothetical protein MNEG_12941 [Monoraphidium neglectum]|uniref:PPIase cyclophilin-type domain-containing protein n=1 Tax=Monoraphidium neglectum TaxID=145388 RepID=A0A0D2MJ42_9CHLO|nr:hypothetical protein MNEG_12941 [Monoraphidium neglectum]KIY95020.1 hypothetical protein MNEG_12941 [Monoraphidium neglectum]|eukprot:XP_013894040.1 hypothetical protein MNEG_12941 [Monoraphidium neglectum]
MQPPRAVPATQLSSSTRTLRHAPFTAQRPHLRGPAPCSAAAPNRRVLIEGAVASALLLVAKPAYADDEGIAAALEVEAAPVEAPVAAAVEEVAPAPVASSSARTGQTVYLDVKLEGQKLGRITIELLPAVAPVGAQRFADLSEGKQGVGYRLARFDRVTEAFVRCEGVKSLSYSADGYSPIAGGDSTQALEEEMASPAALRHDAAGLVSIIVGLEKEREVTEKLVAIRGKLVTVQNVAGEAPNGSAFTITLGPAPELDATNLVVGRVVGGMDDVVAALASLPRAKPRDDWFDKPFFEAGKAIGDKRATVAEKGFNRPLKRAIVSSAGIV